MEPIATARGRQPISGFSVARRGLSNAGIGRLPVWVAVLLMALAAGPAMAGEAVSGPDFAARAEKEYRDAQARLQTATNDTQLAWQFARACFDYAEFATNKSQRRRLAREGIAAARVTIDHEPDSAAGHYYLAMNFGQLARTELLGALRLVDEMEVEFSEARKFDEHFDYAGPDRNLGLLYWQAPSIGSIGSRSKARQHLQRAVELAPDYPDNGLSLIEACLQWRDVQGARRELKALKALWAEARQKFAGVAWESSWLDWDKRLAAVEKRIGALDKVIHSPRQRN